MLSISNCSARGRQFRRHTRFRLARAVPESLRRRPAQVHCRPGTCRTGHGAGSPGRARTTKPRSASSGPLVRGLGPLSAVIFSGDDGLSSSNSTVDHEGGSVEQIAHYRAVAVAVPRQRADGGVARADHEAGAKADVCASSCRRVAYAYRCQVINGSSIGICAAGWYGTMRTV